MHANLLVTAICFLPYLFSKVRNIQSKKRHPRNWRLQYRFSVFFACNTKKFTEYIFKDGAAPGKDVVFKNLGYDINDSSALIKIYEEQAALKYAKGEYTLGKVDSFGQRIDIEIVLPGIGEAAGNTRETLIN